MSSAYLRGGVFAAALAGAACFAAGAVGLEGGGAVVELEDGAESADVVVEVEGGAESTDEELADWPEAAASLLSLMDACAWSARSRAAWNSAPVSAAARSSALARAALSAGFSAAPDCSSSRSSCFPRSGSSSPG